jgi:cell division protein FtsB
MKITKRMLKNAIRHWAKDSYQQQKLNRQLEAENKKLIKEIKELQEAKNRDSIR